MNRRGFLATMLAAAAAPAIVRAESLMVVRRPLVVCGSLTDSGMRVFLLAVGDRIRANAQRVDKTVMWADVAGTIPAVVGGLVARVDWADTPPMIQAVESHRPQLLHGNALAFDGLDMFGGIDMYLSGPGRGR